MNVPSVTGCVPEFVNWMIMGTFEPTGTAP